MYLLEDGSIVKDIPEAYTGCIGDGCGSKKWLRKGLKHREGAPAVISYTEGTLITKWYINDKLHRLEGPAIESDTSYNSWWFRGDRHNTKGAAVNYADGCRVNFFLLDDFIRKDNVICFITL